MNWSLLHKYLTGESTPAEKEILEQWLNADKQNRDFFDSLLKIWSVEPRDDIEIDAKAAWASFKGKLSEKDQSQRHVLQSVHRFNNKRPFATRRHKKYRRAVTVSVAAATIVIAAMLLYIFMPEMGGAGQQTVQQKPKVQELSTELGQRASFRLADDTHVYLNADSRIEIPPVFGDSIRAIQLEGEAYFDVTPNPDVPFVVYTSRSYTRVLGTKFGVKAYACDKQVQVVVEEGKVALGSSDNDKSSAGERHLSKSQEGLMDSTGEIHIENVTSLAHYVGWKDGKLVFESTPFGEVIPRLERWYNIQIKTDPSLLSQQITTSFDDEPMLEVLRILALSMDARFSSEGRTITFNQIN